MGLDTKMPIMDSKKVILKSLEEITLLQKSAQLVSKTLGILAKEIKPGIDTSYLDKIAEEFIRDHKGVPGFLGMYDFQIFTYVFLYFICCFFINAVIIIIFIKPRTI